jgi:hypothetical protein
MELKYQEAPSGQALTVTDSLLVLAIDQGKQNILSALNLEIFTAAITSVLVELDTAGIIRFNGLRKSPLESTPEISVLGDLPTEYASCQTVYEAVVASKHKTVEEILSQFLFSISDKLDKQFVEERMTRLKALGVIDETTSKNLLGIKSTKLSAKPEVVEQIVNDLRNELLGQEPVSDAAIVLTRLLDKTGLLKHYFSAHEQDKLKQRIDESIQELEGKATGDILKRIDELQTFILLLISTTM